MRKLLLLLLSMGVLTLAGTAQAETHEGTFIVRGPGDHARAADPIVSPGVFPSAHEHQFMCNRSTDENSTYASMTAATSSCELVGDTVAAWTQSLKNAAGVTVVPRKMFLYYKTIPTPYRSTVPFPADFRMIADGHYPTTMFWDCFDKQPSGKYAVPLHCATDELQSRLIFPNCWDGWQLDSPDHRSHVVYPVSNACPADHPVKLPRISMFERFPTGSGGMGWVLSDGNTVQHGDYWNTAPQAQHEDLVRRCLNAGINCGVVRN